MTDGVANEEGVASSALPMPQSCKSPVPIILDVDTGVDDALALLLALRCPDADVRAVTCVAGNIDVDQVLLNTLCVLDAADAPLDLPVAKGFAEPLVEPLHVCPQIHGEDGMGDLQPPLVASSRRVRPEHAVQLLLDTLRQFDNKEIIVVALGPLTNVGVAIRLDPSLWQAKVKRLVLMGGAVAGGGNMKSWSEANVGYDPEAAHIVFTSGLPLLMYPLDVYLKVSYSKDDLEALGLPNPDSGLNRTETPGPQMLCSQLASRLLYREMRHFNEPEAVIGDAGAVAVALLDSCFSARHLHVSVELHGSSTRGMTVCDLRGPVIPPDEPKQQANVDVVMDLDTGMVKQFFSDWVLGNHCGARPLKRMRVDQMEKKEDA